MAAVSPLQELCNETTCSICLEYFTDPVTVECGHNFCRACLVQHWATARPEVLCPQCREPVQKKAFRLNWQLANLVEIVKKLEEEKAAEGTKRECKRHQKPLNFFCKYDESLICVGCTEHRDHAVVPLEEAVQKYKEKIQAQMKPLEQSRKNIARRKITDDERNKICLAQLDKEKQKIRTTFKQMQKFLKEKECLWLAQLGDLEKEMEKRQQENVSGFTNKISLLDKLLTEMEEKSKQPAGEFLQDIRSTFRRWMLEARQIVEISSELEEKLRSFCQKGSALNKAMEKFKESLEKTMNKGSLKDARNKVRVILDPDTAHPFLILSEDLDSVKWEDRYQDLPDNPGRFNREFCVLGQGGFLSGRHCWEVEVQEAAGAMWAVGAARESVKRKGIFKFSPNEGIWAVGKKPYDSISPCHLCALTSPEWSPLTLKKEPKKIRVSLEYEEGCVQFFDADTEDLIFTFPSASFREEKIQPFFWVVSGVRMNC